MSWMCICIYDPEARDVTGIIMRARTRTHSSLHTFQRKVYRWKCEGYVLSATSLDTNRIRKKYINYRR